MIGWKSRVLLRHYLEEGLSKTEIAERLGINRKTVARLIQGGELDRDLDEPVRYRPRPPVARKLDPYKAIIQARLEAYPKLSAVRLLEEIRDSLGDGLLAAGRRQDARDAFARAVSLAEEHADPRLPTFRAKLNAITRE